MYQIFLDFWQGGANFPRLFCRGVRWERRTDIWRAGPNRKSVYLNTVEPSCLQRIECSVSSEALKPSHLDDELIHETTSTRPPDVTYVMNAPRPSPYFAALPLPYSTVNENRTVKNGVGLGDKGPKEDNRGFKEDNRGFKEFWYRSTD